MASLWQSISGSAVTFLWPRMLWLLLALPVILVLYASLRARRNKTAENYAGLKLIGSTGAGSRFRARFPLALMLLGLASLILAVARPQASIALPTQLETVILAIDMSGSMRGTDIKPSRIIAAQNAAKEFVAAQPEHVRIGVVAIAATASLVQSPTHNREDIIGAIDRLQPQRGTALGAGLVIALDAALPNARIDVEEFMNPRTARPSADSAKDNASKGNEEKAPPASEAAVILLSDGQSNVGPDPLKAADIAAEHGVHIYTVGIGTPEGVTVNSEGWSMRVKLDEPTLKKIAMLTQADYFRASDAAELKKVYRSLGTRLGMGKRTPTEVTSLFVALGALLTTLAAFLSMWWFNRIL